MITCCGMFKEIFVDKISHIQADLDLGPTIAAVYESEVSSNSYVVRQGQFQFVIHEDLGKLLGRVQPTTCSLDHCPTWLILSSRGAVVEGLVEIINFSLREGRVPPCLKETIIRPLLKKPTLDPSEVFSLSVSTINRHSCSKNNVAEVLGHARWQQAGKGILYVRQQRGGRPCKRDPSSLEMLSPAATPCLLHRPP
ncbi:uncharacterized protein LOC128348143 isoform X2 [Hemicordylus capensis]|uniref:uncharacterized protein LOC128348143 isoform X2 n=1 Tax=Hemicordylus capensis TaxID=884348 RepID=UPI0023044701|nr:uncharacterized protein LOC128348143 isoform X2 [Hemicordylus capensis]